MEKDEIVGLEIALENFKKSKHQPGAHLLLMRSIAEVSQVFLRTPDLSKENFFKRLLKNENYHIRFLALYSFFVAQERGIKLQKETLEELKKTRQNHCPKMDLLFACLERKLKAEQISSQMRR